MDSDHDSETNEPMQSEVVAPEKIGDNLYSIENGGIIKKIITEGEGTATPPNGAEVYVHYVGRLVDGTVFDSSRDRNELFKFKIGQQQVIKGWDKGVATMKKNEKCLLTCKPEFAYGERGSPPKIPANATLEFEVELFRWETREKVTQDGGVVKEVLTKGGGWATPKAGSEVTVTFLGRVKGADAHFDTRFQQPGKLALGDDLSICRGLEETLTRMQKGERCIATVMPDYGYGDAGDTKLNIPPNAELEFDVTLHDLTEGKLEHSMTVEEKIAFSLKKKDQGTELFKAGRILAAIDRYDKVIQMWRYEKSLGSHEKDVKNVQLQCYTNLSACYLKTRNMDKVFDNANEALKIDPNHVKALFRRARVHAERNDDDLALSDLEKSVALPGGDNAEARALMAAVKKRITKQEQKAKQLFSGFFQRVDLSDENQGQSAKRAAVTLESEPRAPEQQPSPEEAVLESRAARREVIDDA